MVFSSAIFVFLYLPILLLGYALTPKRFRNSLLLIASLLFYAWGEPVCILLMLASIGVNYCFGLMLDRKRGERRAASILAIAIAINLALLVYYKYALFLADAINAALNAASLPGFKLPDNHLPVGISFYTFHAISYLVDIYRGQARVQRNPVDFGLYISLFPQLVAGPIVKYSDIESQLTTRHITRDGFADGIKRFTLGLAKKLLIANVVGQTADAIFLLPASSLTCGLAWLGTLCYTIQIYFDFSGYSDMAIGLARMFGFRFLENFNYPYIAQSITEFWRRWHISLSTWFRNYVYIPLGGNRNGTARTCLNLMVVFLLCGLWHGESHAAWNFILWGAYYGVLLVLERLFLGGLIESMPRVLRHIFTMVLVMIGWVIFRSTTVANAAGYLAAMAGFGQGAGKVFNARLYLTPDLVLALGAGIAFSAPVLPTLLTWRDRLLENAGATMRVTGRVAFGLAAFVVFFALQAAIAVSLVSSSYNPFIYYRF